MRSRYPWSGTEHSKEKPIHSPPECEGAMRQSRQRQAEGSKICRKWPYFLNDKALPCQPRIPAQILGRRKRRCHFAIFLFGYVPRYLLLPVVSLIARISRASKRKKRPPKKKYAHINISRRSGRWRLARCNLFGISLAQCYQPLRIRRPSTTCCRGTASGPGLCDRIVRRR